MFVCYEQIKDNFYFAKYGDFSIIMLRSCGFVNVTHLCERRDLNFVDWLGSQHTRELMQSYRDHIALADRVGDAHFGLTLTIMSRDSGRFQLLQGLYLHPELLIPLACWISPECPYPMSQIVQDYLSHKYRLQLNAERERVRLLEGKISAIKQYRTVELVNSDKHHKFVVVNKNVACEYKYYVFRRQNMKVEEVLVGLRELFPQLRVLHDEYTANGVNLYNKMKEELPMDYKGNHFNTVLSEEELLREIRRIAAPIEPGSIFEAPLPIAYEPSARATTN